MRLLPPAIFICLSLLGALALAQAPAGAYRIEVFSSPSGPHYVYDCASAAQCGTSAMFTDYTPEAVTIRVTTSAGTREQTAQPTYSVSRPNGPNCGPECRQAQVTVALPGSAVLANGYTYVLKQKNL